MLSANSTSVLLVADARIPARNNPRNRLQVTGIKSLVKTQAQSHSGEAVKAEKICSLGLTAVALCSAELQDS